MLARAWRDDRRWVIFGLVATVLALFGFLGPWSARLIDLDVYRLGAQTLLQGDDVYTMVEPKAGLLFTYPVFAAVIFIPFSLVPVMVARVVMTLGSFAALFVIAHLTLLNVRRALGKSEEGTLRWSIPLAVGCLGAHPVWDTLNFGQVNLILAAMVMIDALVLRGRPWQGVLVGIATGIKLVPGLFILYFLVTGQRRAAITSALTTAGTVLIGLIVAPAPTWNFFTKYAFSPERTGAVYYATNQSILGTTARLLRDPHPPKALTYALALIAVGIALFIAYRLHRYGDDLQALTTVAVAALLASPISWSHHWVWAIPAAATVALWVLRSPAGTRSWRWWVFGVTTAIMYAGPIYFAPKGGDRELQDNHLQQLWGNIYTLVAVAYLVWGLVLVLRTPDRTPTARRVSSSAG